VILVEPVGMACKACVAFAGGHHTGAFRGIAPQGDLSWIGEYARTYGGVDLGLEPIVLVQVLFYDKDLRAPSAEDAGSWARHFGLDRSQNHVVLVAEPCLLGPQTYDMIPGFQLIDKSFVLRYDSTGHKPRHELYRELLPNIRRLLDESPRPARPERPDNPYLRSNK
jgi:hypothetical protein